MEFDRRAIRAFFVHIYAAPSNETTATRAGSARTKFALVTNCARLRRPGERSIIRMNRDNLTMDKCIAGLPPIRCSVTRRYRAITRARVVKQHREILRFLRSSPRPFTRTLRYHCIIIINITHFNLIHRRTYDIIHYRNILLFLYNYYRVIIIVTLLRYPISLIPFISRVIRNAIAMLHKCQYDSDNFDVLTIVFFYKFSQ